MTTKIDGALPTPRPADPQPMATVAPRTGADKAEPVAALADDSMRLTGDAADLRALQKELSAKPAGIDVARVNALRDAISDGSYKINPNEIASRLVALERALFA